MVASSEHYFWRRLLVVFGIALFGALLWSTAQHLLAGAATRPAAEKVYIARPGDTIWGIAEKYAHGGDPRPLVDQLEGEIGGGVLQPGQALVLP